MLPEAIQPFGINSDDFLAGLDQMIGRADQFAESLDRVIGLAKTMADSLSASADKVAESLNPAAASMDRLGESERATADQADALIEGLGGVTGALDETLAAADRLTEGNSALGDAGKAVADSAKLEADLLADLRAQQALLADGTKVLTDSLVAESRALKLAGDAAETTGVKTAAAGDESTAAGDKVEAAGGKAEAAGGMWKTAMLAVAIALGYGIDKASGFQSSMEQIHTQAGVAQSKIAGLSQGVLKLAGQVGEGPGSLSEALYHVASNMASTGASGTQMLNAVRVAAEGAQVGNANLVDVTNALGAAIASGIPGVQNYTQAMGYMNATVGAGDMTMQDLSDAFGTGVLANIKMYGVTLKDVSAALATFGDNNIRGAKAGTDLRMAVQALVSPVTTAGPALAELGLKTTSFADAMKNGGLNGALELLVSRLKSANISSKDYGEIITDVFGKKAGSGIGVLVGEFDRFQGKYKDVQKGADEFASDWGARTKTMAQQWDDLKSGAQALAISFGSVLLPAATKVVHALTGFTDFLEKHPALAEFAGGLLVLAAAFKVAATAEAIFDAVSGADPLVLALVAVMALAAGLYLLYTHFKSVRDVVADAGAIMRASWADAMHAAGAVTTWFVNGPLAWIKAQIALFVGWWGQHSQEIDEIASTVWHDVASVVTEAWRLIWDMGIRPGLTILEATWRVVWGVIRDTAVLVWQTIGAVVAAGVHIILDVIGIALDLLTGHWSQAWHDCQQLVHDAIYGISNIISTFTHDALTLLVDAGKNVVLGLIHGIESMAGGAWDAIKSVGHGLISGALSVFGIASPSRVFYAMGDNITQGLANGINDTAGRAYDAARTLAANVSAIVGAATAALGGSSFGAPAMASRPVTATVAGALAAQAAAQRAAQAAAGYGIGGGGGGGGGGGSDPYTTAASSAAKAVASATAAQQAEYAKIGAYITDRIGSGITETIPQAVRAATRLMTEVHQELARGQITSAEADELVTKIQSAMTSRQDKLVKAMTEIGLKMRAGLIWQLQDSDSASAAKSAVNKLIGYVQSAWSAGDITASRASGITQWLETDSTKLQELASQRQAILARIKAADAYANTTTSNTESWAGLSNITSNMTSGGMVYSGNILAGMQADLSSIRQFGEAVKRLGREGLSKNLLNQIIQMGPEQGLQVATALLDGPLSVIRSMNATQSAINQASTSLGQTSADLMYDSGAMAGKGFLSGLEGQQKAITAAMSKLAKILVQQIEHDLKIHSPSLVTTEHGEMIALGLANGMEHGVPWVRRSARDLAGATMPGGSQGAEGWPSGGGGNVTYQFNVTVTGGWVGDERTLAQEFYKVVQEQALQHDRRNGNNGFALTF